jgi:hypothetical protein
MDYNRISSLLYSSCEFPSQVITRRLEESIFKTASIVTSGATVALHPFSDICKVLINPSMAGIADSKHNQKLAYM